MPKTAPLTVVLAPLILAGSLQRAAQHPDIQVAAPEMRFDNGLWFDDSGFIRATVFVEDGRLRFAANRAEAGRAANRVIDLRGRYVVPPFCEAHNHNLGLDSEQNSQHINNYLRDGVFYVNVLSDLPREAAAVWHTYNTPQSVDAQFANGGITGPGGHPIRLRELLLARGLYQGFTKESLRNHAYYVIDSDADLESTWPLILQYRPDFLKLILVHSEEYEKRRDDPAYFGDKGLKPEVFARIVEKARAFGLRTSAHVNSAHDFHVAVTAGVDNIAHLPGTRDVQRIDSADAVEAARRGITVTTTAGLINRIRDRDTARYALAVREEHRNAARNAQIASLRLLKAAGVTIAVGSDEFDDTSVKEVAHLRSLGVFNNAEMLRMWTTNCARTVFPRRRVGRLADGYEASFLVLDGDPLKDFSMTGRIVMRVKDGRVLELGSR